MPDVWTHLITGDRVSKGISRPGMTVINDHRSVFDFGCQGPDFFLYYDFWPWSRDKRGSTLGDAIHHEHCGAFFEQSFSYIASLAGSSDYHAGIAYGLGLLCHWALDRTTHPYIHYISGVHTSGDPSVAHLAGNHKRIEAIIDSLLVREYWGIATDQSPANQRFDLGATLPAYLANLYQRVIPVVYPDLWREQAPGCVAKSYRDMMTACRVLFDPTGIKKRALSWLQRVSGDHLHLSSYFYPNRVNASIDYLNTHHLPWCHPADRQELSTASFGDLLDQAVTDGIAMANCTIDYLAGEFAHQDWLRTIGNLSFSTGKDCDLPLELRYTQPILD